MPNPSSHSKPVVLMTMGAQARSGHAYQVMTHKYITPPGGAQRLRAPAGSHLLRDS